MSVLNNWQKLQYIVGSPFGTGASGSATISSDPNTRATITGTATQFTSTLGSAILTNGDVVMLHQTQGTGAGQWEFKRVASGGGTTSITWTTALNYSYTTGAQCIKVPQYTTATVSAHSVTAWNGTTGGIEVILAKTSITVSGVLSVSGATGASGNPAARTSGGGFRGGASGTIATPSQGQQGEGTGGGLAATTAKSGSAPGGTYTNDANAGGGGTGGSHAAAGTSGSGPGGYYTPGTQGDTVGSTDLTTIEMGAGGGGGARGSNASGSMGGGGSGAGIVILISKSITLSAGVTANGGNSGGVDKAGGGAGAGGSILVVCNTASLGSSVATATGGTGGGSPGDGAQVGGGGSVGRIAVHHSGTVTGTTSPTFTDVTDTTLNEIGGLLFSAGL